MEISIQSRNRVCRACTRIWKLKSNLSGVTLADGKGISGRGRLTQDQTDSIQSHYANAIRGNKSDLVKIREGVWGIFFQKQLTDSSPRHNFCREKCPYKNAEAEARLDTYKHSNNIPTAIMDVIKPVFKDLANTQLLTKKVPPSS